jgi:hypothetical protein
MHRLAGFALALGLVVLIGCVPEAPTPVAIAVAPVAVAPPPAPPPPPPPVALLPAPPPPVWVAPPPAPRIAAAPPPHPFVHRHLAMRRYRTEYVEYVPGCGSDAHPCTQLHVMVPIQ